MTGLADLVLLRPWWLLAIPVALALAWLARRGTRRPSSWTEATDPRLLAALERLGRVVPSRAGAAAGLTATLAAALLALALAGPARQTREPARFRNLEGVVLVVDLGPAAATDRLPDTLIAARLVAEAAATRPVGLIVYAGDAYEAQNFTTDAAVLGNTLAVLDRETVPDAGRRPERALALADRMTREAGLVFADVVLVGSGAGIGPPALEAVRGLAAAGRRLSTVHDGTAGAGDMAALARLGGGVAAGIDDPGPVMETVASWRRAGLGAADLAALVWTDYGRALLVPALLPAFLLFRRRR